jgi:hypothetical protein
MTIDKNVKQERVQLLLSSDELKAIDDWRFANRYPNRNASIRELIRRGLAGIQPN